MQDATMELKQKMANINFKPNEIFKYNLRLLRTSQQLSGEELSIRIKMAEKRINDLEGGRMPPNLEDLIKITSHFNITFDDLLTAKISLLINSHSNK